MHPAELSTTLDASAPVIGWTSWAPDVFPRAARERKLVFLWIAARWAAACRAMEADALADPAVIDLINRRFVAVKVDSDERPDISERYNLGGWPTTAILTDEGEVLTGGTSFSGDGLLALLGRSLEAVAVRGDAIRARAEAMMQARHDRLTGHRDGVATTPDGAAVTWLRQRTLDELDQEYGGFGRGAKFPHVPALRFLLRLARVSTDPDVADALTLSLDAMGEGGLRDRRDGGFFRYTDARDWSAPCPDKTLEDNAVLLGLYAEAAEVCGRRDYVEIARDTLPFVRQKLADVEMFATGLSADAVQGCLAVAALLADPSLRDFTLASLDRVVLNVYRPAHGVAHWYAGSPSVWGLLNDQVRVAEAALAAHEVTGSPVYSMLAEELMRYALRVMWDEETGAFLDRASGEAPDDCGLLRQSLRPLASNCEAASVLLRLHGLTGQDDLRDRALRILRHFAGSYRSEGLLGVPYALAMLEAAYSNPESRTSSPESRIPNPE